MITYQSLYQEAIETLRESGNPDAAFDARCLMEKAFGFDRIALSLHRDHVPEENKDRYFRRLFRQRAEGEPLQYLIGIWGFLDESFQIGPGVLIPRPETELLALTTLQRLESWEHPVVFDLCAGSGCLGLSIAKRRPDAEVFLLEKSEAAFAYLRRNADRIAPANTHLQLGDLMDGFQSFDFPAPQVIVSNPPYIRSAEISGLQREVRHEPRMAPDGGEDGLLFYRVLAERWVPSLSEGGMIAVECGEGQADEISAIFQKEGLHTCSYLDYGEIDRIVTGGRPTGAIG